MMRHHLPAAFCVAALLALAPVLAHACGIPFEARITYERALLIVDGERQQLITSVDLSEANPAAAVIFPIPGEPQVDQPPGGDALFAYLQEATRPEVRREQRLVWRSDGDGAGAAGGGSALLGRETLGGYDVARLAGESGAVLAWLDQNGYQLPPAAAPILAAYAAEGWRFVAVKLADAAPNGSLAPLRISYQAERALYPMRLGALSDRPVAVDLYVLAAGRMAAERLETTFAGPTMELAPPAPPALARLIDGPYLTRLRSEELDPATLTADFLITPAADDAPFRQVITIYEDIPILERTGIILGLFCVVAMSGLALAVAVGLRRRMDALSPDPEARPRRPRAKNPSRR